MLRFRVTGKADFARLWLWSLVFVALLSPGWLWASNAIVVENSLPGTAQSVWDISGAGDASIQGFATQIGVNVGDTVNFKIKTDATSYHLDIYRMGYYGGNGARKVATVTPSATLPQNQPACFYDSGTGLYDCGNWAISASWTASNVVSGIYFAKVIRDDTQGASHIVFIVRNDASHSDITFQTSDLTWQAYNDEGGQNLSGCNGAFNLACRAFKVSYNRPFHTRVFEPESWVFNAEYPMVRWLEANGYDVTYTTGVDTDRNGGLLLNHKVWMSNGHDGYWSGNQRANVEAARNAGVNLAFFSGNTMFWKTRWENSTDSSHTPYRTLVCYKETNANAVIDPDDPPTSTATWRDPRFGPPAADGDRPENAVVGTLFRMNGGQNVALTVPDTDGKMRFWRGTAVASLPSGQSATLAPGTIGTEFDDDEDNGFRPAGLFELSATSVADPNNVLLDYGSTYGAGTVVHKVTTYKAPSGAMVFASGTYQWSWGLDANHDRSSRGSTTDLSMQQATVNLFADMQVQPALLQSPLIAASASTDTIAPTSTITFPLNNGSLLPGAQITITGTATDTGGGVVAGVEVSTDGGATWHPAIGRASWTYTTILLSGTPTIRSRAVDDSGNLESPSAGVTVNVGLQTCPCSIWTNSDSPVNPNDSGKDNSVELGNHFKADYPGSIIGIRFYKSPNSTGTHVGNLWDPGGALLASKAFTNETASGWQTVIFDNPVAITANRTVVASYHIDNGYYFDDVGYFNPGPHNNPPLHGYFSVFAYGTGPSVFPAAPNNNNYWVDVVYTSPSMVTLTSITVTPSQATIQPGGTQQFTATGHYNDGSSQNITTQVTWSSSNTVAATINSSGLATALSGDSPVITASKGGVSGSAVLSIQGGALSITTTSVPDGMQNMPYSFQLTATGGVQPYTWTLVSGALPAGLTLSSSGQITGTPTTLQTANFTVKVSDSGTKESINQPQTASGTLSLTIDPRASYFSIWPDTAVPATIDFGDPSPYELGVKFKADLNGTISGIRFYKSSANIGTHIGNLWTTSGTLLGSATFSSETASGWQQVNFGSQVPIIAGTVYVASYHTNTGHYSANTNQFAAAGVDNPPLHALQNGISGGNGVFAASTTSRFPNTNSSDFANYWVDVVFNPATWTAPPTVVSVTPASGSSGLDSHGTVSAVFSTWMDPNTINGNTFYLLDPSNNVVPATVTYNTATLTATLTPNSALLYSATYTAVIVGGGTDPRVKDLAENPLASNFQWSFTAAAPPPPPPTSGPGGPILVVSSATNPFSLYYAEILRAEGLNEFAVQDISTVTGVAALSPYDIVILGDTALTADQVTTFSQWVNNGGKLIAMHPDTQLANLLGLVDTSSALSNAYLLMNTSSGPGVGLVGQTIQFHGPAELYTLNTATSYANLYSNATTPSGNPAVTLNSAGLGQAAAFTYDLAKSVIYTRQGNPAWSGQARDDLTPKRSDDLFFGNALFDKEADWVDFNKIQIPQADEQQRLLANLILQMETKPLPRFWYFPQGLKAVIIMTGDDHGTFTPLGGATGPRFDQYIAASAPGCRVDNWGCVRATGYLFPPLLAANPLSNAQAAAYVAEGFEVAVHTDTSPDCSNFTQTSLDSAYTAQLSSFASAYPSVPASQTNRTHCVAWSDYDSEPQVELGHGMRLDTTYYYYPSTWVNDRPGLFTGSGMPMRFTKSDGTMLDIYQAATQLTDESGQTYPFEIDTLLDNALNLGYYGAFTANMHADTAISTEANAIVASAQAQNVPIVSALQMLHWLDGRNGSSFAIQSWDGSTLTFNILVGDNAYGLQAMLPASMSGVALGSLTLNGTPVSFTNQLIKGIQYSVFAANADGTYQAHYGATGVASISLNPTSVIGGNSSTGTVTLNRPSLTDTVVALQSGTPAAATVPPSVTIPHGSTSATFTVSTSSVSTSAQVVISGSFNNTLQSATLTVNPQLPATTTVSLTTGTNPSIYAQSLTFTATVTGAGVTPTGNVSFYDGGTCASPGSLLATAALLNGSAQASSALTAVGSPHTVLACYGGDVNYTSNSGTLSQTVNPATVTPSIAVSNKVYNGTTTATITTRTLSGVVGSDDVTLTGGAATFANANVGTAKTVTATGLTLGGTTAGNYQLSSTTATTTADITVAAITVTADAQTKVYGSADPTFTYQVTNGSLVTGDSFTGALTRVSGENVGTHAIQQGTLALSSNYTLTYVGANLTITARPVTVTADAKSKTYGDSDPPLTYQVTTGSLITGDSLTGSLTRVSGENVGTYAIQQGTLALNSNYTLTYVGANLTITARPVTVTADAKSKTYGDSDPPLTYQVTAGSLITGDSFTGSLARASGENAGTHAIQQGTLALGSNYTLTYVGANLTITARPVTVTADAKSKTYGDSDPPLTYQVTAGSLITGDSFTGSLARASGENAGTHAIQQGTLALSSNYTLTYVGANLTITARPVTVTADAQSKAYGSADPTFTYQVTSGSLVTGDSFAGALTRASGENAGAYSIHQGTLALSGNYTLAYVGANLTITAAPLTVTAANASRRYGAPDPLFTGAILGIQSNDNITATFSTTATQLSAVGTYPIIPALVDPGNKLGNYVVVINNGSLTITEVPLTIVANDKTRAFGASDPAFDVHYIGFLNGDTSSSLGGNLVCATTAIGASEAGSYAIRCSGQSSSNYTLHYADGTLTISDPLLAIAVTPNNDPQIAIGQSQPFLATGTFADPAQRQLAGASGFAFPLENLPSTRSGAAAAEAGGKLYVIGGLANGETTPSLLVDAYDPVANSWSTVASLGTTRRNAGAASIAGKIYVVGGCADAACTSNVSTVEVYDPSAPSPAWTTVSSTGFTARNTLAVGVIDGKLYVAGGNDNSGNPLNVLEVYDPAANTWSTLAAMPAMSQPTGGVVAGKFYVEGSNAGASVLVAYDPSGNTWTSLAGMATAAPGAGASALNSKLYVVAGQNISEYDPTGNAWTAKHTLTTARSLPQPVTIGNLFYVAGNGASGQSAVLEGFASDEVSWSSSNTGEVAVNQSGLATGSAAGSVQIIATSLITPAISGQAPLTVISTPATTSVSLTSGTNPSLYGQSLTFTATVTGAGVAPTGNVSFYDGGTCASPGSLLATAVLLNGSAQASSSALTAVGSPHTILACYNGDANYTSSSGTVSQTVNLATFTPSITVSNKVYDGTTTATIATRTLSGAGTDGVTLTGGTATFADSNVGTGKTVTVTDLALSGSNANNYRLSSTTATTTADITAAALTVTANTQTKVYGSADPALSYTVTSGSLATGDSFTGALTRASGESAGAYAIQQNTLALSSNYTLTYVGANLTITAAPLTIKAADASRPYGAANPALTGTLTGVVNNDGITATFSTAAGVTSPVGNYSIVPSPVDPNSKLGNYAVTLVNGTLTVGALPLTVTAANAARSFGAPDPPFTGTIVGLVNNDNITATFSTPATITSPSGVYAIVPSLVDPGNRLGNYSVTINNGVLTITALTVTSVSVNPTSVTGGSIATGTVTLSGIAPSGGAAVALQSDTPSLATVPANVTVPAGNTSANFTVSTSQAVAATVVNISAAYNNSSQSGRLTVNPPIVSQTGWSVVYVDSQETVGENGAAVNAIDGNPNTNWITQWNPTSAPMPHEIRINLGGVYSLRAFQYLTRQDGCANGWIKDYDFDVSLDGVNWNATPLVVGTFSYGSLSTTCPGAGVPGVMQVNFPTTTAQYILFRARSEINGNPWAAVAEINVVGVPTTAPPAAVAQVSLNPAVVTGGNPSTGTVTLTTAAPSGGALVTLSSSDPSAGVPANVTVNPGAKTATFTITTDSVSSSTSVSIGATLNGSKSATLMVNPVLVSQTGWSVVYVDSQETVGENGAALNAIDGNPNTKWVTQWDPTSAPMPHEIQINLGGMYSLTAFQYLARQDGCANGWIKQYEFYVSTDGVNWGTAVATGTYNYGALSTKCPGGGVPSALQVPFPATTGQYIRLRALSEINGNPWTAVAEINVIGVSTTAPPPAVAQVSLNPAVVTGGNPSTGTVTLTTAAPSGGALVTLSSGDPSAGVPDNVTVNPGAKTATFNITTTSVSSSTSVSIGATLNGSKSATLTVNPVVVSQTGWSVVYVDSQETVGENGAAVNAIDGNPNTKWVTQWDPTSAPMPHEIHINLGGVYSLTAFQYLARQDGCANGWIKDYDFDVSLDGVNWNATPLVSGTFSYGRLSTTCPGAGVPGVMQVNFPATTAQYILFRARSEINGKPWAAVAEINVVGVPTTAPPPAVAQVSLNPAVVTGGNPSTGTVTLTTAAPSGGALVTLSSGDPSAGVPDNVTVNPGAKTATFNITTTSVSSSTSVSIGATLNGSKSATLTVNPVVVSQTGWSVVYVDSQETVGENGAAVNAIDGNPNTKWVTQWNPTSAPMPHEIRINLGGVYSLTAFQYLARQDGCANGWIKDYDFDVSLDGVNWNATPLVSGTFSYGNLSTGCPGAGVPGVMQVNFPPTTAQYILFRARSEINGNPWAAVAEINVLGTVSTGNPPPTLAHVTVNPAIVVGGTSAQGTVSLSGPAPLGGVVVNLASSDSAAATVPTSVTVPANLLSATFPITTKTVGAVTPVTITGTYNNGSAQAGFTVNPGSLISQAGWSLWYVDSQEKTCKDGAGNDGSGTHAFDNNPATMWLTQVCDPNSGGMNIAPLPHEIQINLGASYNLTGFQYLAPQDGNTCGWIKQYEFYVSTDGSTWGSPLASGSFNYGAIGDPSTNCTGVPPALQIAFQQTTGQYIRLRALSEQFGNQWIAAAELNVLSTASASSPSVAQVTVNPAIVVGGTSAQGTVTLSGPAPAGGALVNLGSNNGVATVQASVIVPANATSVNFPITTAASVGSATQLTISGTYNGSAQAGFTVNPGSLISQAGWSLVAVDSQETTCLDGAGLDGSATHAFDGNNATMWLTQVCPSQLPLPHYIQINLGASYDLTGFQYRAAQDGNTCGWIKGYQFYVSADGVNWPTQPNAQGTFNYGTLGTSCAAIPPALQVAFPQTTGQYIRLVALSEQFGNPLIAVAELNALAAPSASLAAAATTITAGSSTTLTPTFSGGTGSIDQGVGTVVSGTPVSVSPSATTTYTLTVTNTAGSKVTATATITVVP